MSSFFSPSSLLDGIKSKLSSSGSGSIMDSVKSLAGSHGSHGADSIMDSVKSLAEGSGGSGGLMDSVKSIAGSHGGGLMDSVKSIAGSHGGGLMDSVKSIAGSHGGGLMDSFKSIAGGSGGGGLMDSFKSLTGGFFGGGSSSGGTDIIKKILYKPYIVGYSMLISTLFISVIYVYYIFLYFKVSNLVYSFKASAIPEQKALYTGLPSILWILPAAVIIILLFFYIMRNKLSILTMDTFAYFMTLHIILMVMFTTMFSKYKTKINAFLVKNASGIPIIAPGPNTDLLKSFFDILGTATSWIVKISTFMWVWLGLIYYLLSIDIEDFSLF